MHDEFLPCIVRVQVEMSETTYSCLGGSGSSGGGDVDGSLERARLRLGLVAVSVEDSRFGIGGVCGRGSCGGAGLRLAGDDVAGLAVTLDREPTFHGS